MKHRPIPIERAKRLLAHEPSSPSGLVWRVRRGGNARAGSPAGYKDARGYYRVTVDNTHYLAHRLVYAIVTGTDPGEHEIDHIDGNPANNQILNLRKAAHTANGRNTRSQRGSSQYLGVCWYKGKWQAQITANGKQHYLGRHDLETDAARAYDAAARELHPGGRLNFPLPTDINQTPAHEHSHRDRKDPLPSRTGTA